MKQVVRRSGSVDVLDVPPPQVERGRVRVRTVVSCISAGTEGAGIGGGMVGVVTRAVRSPDIVRQVVRMAKDRGVANTAAMVKAELERAAPLGYSSAGVVDRVGAGVPGVEVGDRVACAGGGYASHAAYGVVPENLVTPIPDGVSFEAASSVALGSIALHGVRRLEPTLGEWFVVLGLGLLGQLAAQMLRAHGCRVIGVDLDAGRVELARGLGIDEGIDPEAPDAIDRVKRLTGMGADGVLVTAASRSDEVMSTAFRMCRRKGRVVLVGDVGLGLMRSDIYPGELELRIATSYGPGRYDDRYEAKGYDYPPAYVRWTEGRNMEEYLRLLADGTVRFDALVHGSYPVERAREAYDALDERGAAPIVLLTYDDEDEETAAATRLTLRTRPARRDRINMAIVGAGSFASGMHLPNLQRLRSRYALRAVVGRTGLNAREAAARFDVPYATTALRDVLEDDDVDAVLIATRHDSHADLALRALQAGKHVMLEKPLALTEKGLAGIESFYQERRDQEVPVLLTGFNRRFSPFAARIRQALDDRTNPAMLAYRMNAGFIPLDHWVHGDEGGGRNIGEACHIYDLFHFLLDGAVTDLQAAPIGRTTGRYARNDNFTATLRFEDGSVATLLYTALGHKALAKEHLEAFTDGGAAVLDDYRSLELHGFASDAVKVRGQDKGHLAELEAFAAAVRGEAEWPIPLWQQLDVTRISFRVERLIERGGAEPSGEEAPGAEGAERSGGRPGPGADGTGEG